MPKVAITGLGRGRNTRDNPSLLQPGEARDSLNLLNGDSAEQCLLRGAIGRVNASRAANARVCLIADLVKSDGTRVKILKVGGNLYTFTNTFASTPASFLALGDSTHLPGYATANGFMFLADWRDKNYVSDGTSSHSHELQKTGPQGTVTLANRPGTAAGNAAGNVKYWITDIEPTTGEETPPGSPVTIARLADEGVALSVLTYTGHFTSKGIYRAKAGLDQPYLVTILTGSTTSYNDDSLDTSLTTVSEVHDEDGVASIEKPEAATHMCFHRGRLFLANLAGSLFSRLRWSRIDKPTQFSNSDDAFFDVGKADGQEITGIVSFRGSLVIFKTYSIWVLNGDLDETNFVLAPVVKGVGCVAPRTIVVDGDRFIYFLSHQGVYRFDLGQLPELALSDKIAPDLVGLAFGSRADFFCAGIEPRARAYQVSVSPSGATTNTKTHAIAIDTGSWGRRSYCMGEVQPTCYSALVESPVVDSNGEIRLYLGDELGFIYQAEAAASGADGEPTGDVVGTVTAYDDGTGVITCGAAAFMTTGDKLIGFSVTKRAAASGLYETKIITASAATTVTAASNWTVDPVAGDVIFIGAIQATLSLGRFTGGTDQRKRFVAILAGIEKQTHTYPLRIGYTLDGDTAPTETSERTMTRYHARFTRNRRATGLSPYFDLIGVDMGFELLSLHIEFEVLGLHRRPTG